MTSRRLDKLLTGQFQRLVFVLFIAGLLSGCDEILHLADPDKTLVVQVQDNGDAKVVDKMLQRRFAEWNQSSFANVKSRISGSRIFYTFSRGSPKREVADFLVSHPGRLEARIRNGEVLFTDGDVAGASAAQSQYGPALHVTVVDQAAQRIKRITLNNIGRNVEIRLDNQLVVSAQIRDALSKRFEISFNKDLREVALYATILRTGWIPVKLSIVQNDL